MPASAIYTTTMATPSASDGAAAVYDQSTVCRLPKDSQPICGHVFATVSPRTIKQHISMHHPEYIQGERTNCGWCTDSATGRTCGHGLSKGHLHKHICNVHLKMAVCWCSCCGGVFSRPDALKRHLKNTKCGGIDAE
ncbi:uncharacterized protein C8Q71DRAFT_720872 [Rhodofomes roseus]|uniref:C2H2-type domain-containing protein n=1 Tax=Rhodofomes roseus TaxID=34475 RepID=A0ABQ8KUM8_9APHY|nr:uncharacterized protein C8Q71DRAFT_720872 [Rhodofomes roseus]KAH9841781.1 hypothetical protein C8Q71DRAFT_720872 [Rhodofomes roseus]